VQYLIAGAPVPARSSRVRSCGSPPTRASRPTRMVADRYHLYGREVLPVAYRAVIGGDPDAARADRMLLDHVEPYPHYAPESRLTKFGAESQARTSRRHVRSWPWPTCSTTGARGSAAVTKPGFAKFAWLPEHDDWLFDRIRVGQGHGGERLDPMGGLGRRTRPGRQPARRRPWRVAAPVARTAQRGDRVRRGVPDPGLRRRVGLAGRGEREPGRARVHRAPGTG